MRLVWSLLRNPHIHIWPYLHQLMRPVMTCLVAKRLGNKFSDNHWDLRNFTSSLVAFICKRFGVVCHNLKPIVTNTLVNFFDPTKDLPQCYGAVQGLAALGPNVRLKILRNLKPHLRLLEPEMQLEKQKNERHEAWLVYGALMRAAGLCVHDRLKMLPSLPSAPPHTACKSNSKVVTTSSNKRKANMDNMMHQPPLKKSATDSSVGVAAANSVAVNIAEASSGGYSTNTDSNMQSSRPLSNNNIAGSSSRREIVGGQRLKASATLKLAWK